MGLLQVALLGERLNNPWAPNRSTRLTRGLWYRLGTVHDLETKVDMSSRSFQISVWTAHHAQLAIIFFWASVPLLQLGWQGDYEAWIQNPTVIPIAHAIRDPHFSASAVSAFSASITCTTGVYEWYYTIGLRTSAQLITAASFLVILGGLCLTAGVIHGASRRTFHFPRPTGAKCLRFQRKSPFYWSARRWFHCLGRSLGPRRTAGQPWPIGNLGTATGNAPIARGSSSLRKPRLVPVHQEQRWAFARLWSSGCSRWDEYPNLHRNPDAKFRQPLPLGCCSSPSGTGYSLHPSR